MNNLLNQMENLTIAEIQKIVEKEKRIRELALVRYHRYKEKNPEKYREHKRVYMVKYNQRKREEKQQQQSDSE